MVRQRKPGGTPQKQATSNETSSSSGNSDSSETSKAFSVLSSWKTLVGLVCLMIAVYIGTLGYLETRVNTPFVDKKVVQDTGLAVPERYWGSYRPGVYFGMKTREPRSPVYGLMWYDLNSVPHKGIRHWCEQSDNLPSYGWHRHDGVTFGEQIISDPPHTIITSFVKTPGGEHGGHWTARINVTAKGNAGPFMLIWYGALDESLGSAAPSARLWLEGGAILGHDPQLRNFRVNLHTHQDFIEQDLVDFAKQNPGVVVYLKPRRHRGPVAVAEYLNGDRVWMNFSNKTHSEITKWIEVLRTQQGDVASTRLRKYQYTDHPSIQGPWTPFTFKNPELNTAELPNVKFGANDRLPMSATEQLRLMFEKQKLSEGDVKTAE